MQKSNQLHPQITTLNHAKSFKPAKTAMQIKEHWRWKTGRLLSITDVTKVHYIWKGVMSTCHNVYQRQTKVFLTAWWGPQLDYHAIPFAMLLLGELTSIPGDTG